MTMAEASCEETISPGACKDVPYLENSRSSKEVVAAVILSSQTPPLPYVQDGGVVAWMQVAMGFLLMFSSWGLINAFGVYQDYYATEPALSTTSSISWIGSVSSCLLLFCGAFSGRLLDAGYGRFMTIAGSILIVLGMLCTSFSGGNGTTVTGKADLVYWQILLSQGVCCGLGMGLVFLPSVGIPATYFVKRRALATGIVTSGASLGGIIYPVIFEQLLDTIGFRWAARVVALVALFTLAAACLLLRQRTDLPRKAKAPMVEFVAFKEPAFLALTLGMAGSFVGVYVPYYFIQTRVEAIYVNLNGLNTIYLVSFLNVGGVFGRLIPNYIADKTGPLFVHASCVMIGSILIFAWPFAQSLISLIVFALIYGFFSGAFISLPPASVASVTTDMSRYGGRFGIAVTLNGFAVLAGPPIAGAIVQAAGYVDAAIFAGLVAVLGSLGLATAGLLSPHSIQKFKLAFQ